MKNSAPIVSVVLPTYNRASFLPQALATIAGQEFADWELIVVDDGSTDDTAAVVDRFAQSTAQHVCYVHQDNQGPYAARNVGAARARGRYLAFYDSDDAWRSCHLAACVSALEAYPDVDWVYGACRMVDLPTGRTLAESHFRRPEGDAPFLQLQARRRGDLRVLDDPGTLQCAILYGLECGLQHSVMRREVHVQRPFHVEFRNEFEDQLAVIRAAAAGQRFGYFDRVHVDYAVHDGNSTAPGQGNGVDKRAALFAASIRGFEELAADPLLPPTALQAVRQRLACEYFWRLGYGVLWQGGRREEALAMFWRGMKLRPAHLPFWKTYAACWLRSRPTRRIATQGAAAS